MRAAKLKNKTIIYATQEDIETSIEVNFEEANFDFDALINCFDLLGKAKKTVVYSRSIVGTENDVSTAVDEMMKAVSLIQNSDFSTLLTEEVRLSLTWLSSDLKSAQTFMCNYARKTGKKPKL